MNVELPLEDPFRLKKVNMNVVLLLEDSCRLKKGKTNVGFPQGTPYRLKGVT